MATLSAGLPNARIFVASIPDIYQLFSIYRWHLGANSVWAVAGICQSMLAYPFSDLPGVWREIPERTAVSVRAGGVLEEQPFQPKAGALSVSAT